MAKLDGKVALVTGGGRGIGRGVALALARLGANVVVTARSMDEISAVADEINQQGGRALAVPGDVADFESVQHVVAMAQGEFGPVDMLYNNAGIFGPVGPIWETDPEKWVLVQEINLIGTYFYIRLVVPGMVERGWGRVVNVSSGAGRGSGSIRRSAYSVSKASMDMLTRVMAAELDGTGVAVTSIAPGMVDTAMMTEVRTTPAEIIGADVHERFQQVYDDGELSDAEMIGELLAGFALGDFNGEIVHIRDTADQLRQLLANATG